MTKQQEIEKIRQFANELGENSYCGNWLLDQIPRIEYDMKCDLVPQMTWEETRNLEQSTLRLASEQAQRITEQAEAAARATIKAGSEKARDMRIAAIDAIKNAIKEIGGIE